jgi:hypothetical protein
MCGARPERQAKRYLLPSVQVIALKNKDSDRAAIVSENVDFQKLEAFLSSAEGQAAMKAHTVLEPTVYTEVPGAK